MPQGRVETFRAAMPQLGDRERTIRVYLPPSHDAARARFPVLYFQDGQHLFHAYSGALRIDETMDRLAQRGRFDGAIVVGIDNSEHRWAEYGPWTNTHMHAWIAPEYARPTEGGEGGAYLAFITETLKPEIDRRYHTRSGRDATGIGGMSMGGVISLYAGLTRPDVFSKVMAMSPSIWFAEEGGAWLSRNRLLGRVRERHASRDVRFYVDVGTDERSRDTDPDVVDAAGERLTYPRAYLDGAVATADALRAAGVPSANVDLVVERGAVHEEAAWARRFEGAVMWLFA